MTSPKTKGFNTLWIIFSGLIIGYFIYRYYCFALFYQEQKQLEGEIKKISQEAQEIFLKNQRLLNQSSYDDHPRIVIKIETD